MDDEHGHRTDHTDGLPSFFMRIAVEPRRHERVLEYKLSSFKAELVLSLVLFALFLIPDPRQDRALL
jgi:hypothetical protein